MKFALAAVAALVLAAQAAAAPPTLTVYAAASLTEVFPRIDPPASATSFGGPQPARVPDPTGRARRRPRIGESRVHAGALPRRPWSRSRGGSAPNKLVLAVPRSNPPASGRCSDLKREGRQTRRRHGARPHRGVYARCAERLGMCAVLTKVVSEEPDVKGIVGQGRARPGRRGVRLHDRRSCWHRIGSTRDRDSAVGAAEGALRGRRRPREQAPRSRPRMGGPSQPGTGEAHPPLARLRDPLRRAAFSAASPPPRRS